MANIKKPFAHKILAAFFVLVGGVAAWWLLGQGFFRLQELRQLERVPVVKAGAVLRGESNLTAWAEVLESTIPSHHTKTPSLYFRYTLEVETRDSDGNTRWETRQTIERSVNFWLADQSGRIKVEAGRDRSAIDWSVKQSFRETRGKHRYTEWRIEPGQRVYTFAKAVERSGELVLSYNEPGYYTPIVSNRSQKEAQATIGSAVLFYLWGGLAGVALVVLGVVFLFSIHRLLIFLALLSAVLCLVLVQLSLVMMERDIRNGITRHEAQTEATQEQLVLLLDQYGYRLVDLHDQDASVFVSALSDKEQLRFDEFRVNAGVSHARLQADMEAIPEKWLIPLWGLQLPQAPTWLDEANLLEVRKRVAEFPVTDLSSLWTKVTIVLGWLLFLSATFFGIRLVRFKRLIENIPCVRTLAVSCGLAEVQGRVHIAEDREALTSPLTKSDCTWYHYRVEERRRSGKKTRWVTIEDRKEHMAFFCEDDEGRLLIRPGEADVISGHRQVEKKGKRRYTEISLRIDDPLYAIGMAKVDKHKSDRLVMEKGDFFEPFILSNYAERDVMLIKARHGMGCLFFAFCALLLALLIGFGTLGDFAATDFLIAALAAPFYLIAVMFILHYNDLVYLRGRAQRNWSNIEVSLKKRRNLYDGLTRIVKRYCEHEKNLLARLSKLRASLGKALKDEEALDSLLGLEASLGHEIKMLVENYPDLKANSLSVRLMQSLTRLENEVALLRTGYNDSVELYNTRIATFPDVFFARMGRFLPMKFVRAG